MHDSSEELRDLGFGERASQDATHRLLNRDGTFNVVREGRSWVESINLHQLLLSISWTRFNLLLVGTYLTITATFALAYVACGPDAIDGSNATTPAQRILDAFYFSVHTITTVGYGNLTANGLAANLFVTVEAFIGMSGIAVAAGLIFARVATPRPNILFSDKAIVDTTGPRPSFRFRIANGALSELIEAEVRVILAKTEQQFGIRTRRFHDLQTERKRVAFFPLDWTVVHPVGEHSPLYGMTRSQMEEARVEFLVMINAVDDTTGQEVHARSSYRADEVEWDMRYVDMFKRKADGTIGIDLRKISVVEPVTAKIEEGYTLWDT